MSYLKDFLNYLTARNYPLLIQLWEEYCLSDEVDPEELKSILLHMKNSDFVQMFGKHVEAILPLWETVREGREKHEIFQLIIDLQTTNTEELRQRVILYLTNRFPNALHLADKMKVVGLKSQDNFQGSVASFELLNHMQKGKFVFHKGGWGVGEIMEVSALRQQLSIEFENVIEKKELSFINCFQVLTPLPDDHFLALRFGSPDELEKEAKKNPVDVMRMLLKDLGPKTAAEIKDELCGLVIPDQDWTKWWQNTRSKLKRDTMIEAPDDLKHPFLVRQAELSHEDRFRKMLDAKTDILSMIQLTYSFIRDYPEVLRNSELKAFVLSKVQEALSSSDVTDSYRLQLNFILEDLSYEPAAKEITRLIEQSENIEALVQLIDVLALKKRALVAIKKDRKDWKERFLNLLLTINQYALRDYIFTELLHPSTHQDLVNKLEELVKNAVSYPEVFVWYFQKIMDEKANIPFAEAKGRCKFFEAFFFVLYKANLSPDERDLVKKMQAILSANRYAVVRQIMKGSSVQEAKEFLLLASKCQSLSDHDLKILHSLAEVVHPELSKMRKNELDGEKETIIWTTEAGFRKIQSRIQEIATVETIENAKEIEVARSHGDLRENAEFKAALERRDRLQTELKELSSQMHQARIITRADISTDQVGIGCIVSCQNREGKILSYTLLGPWDADTTLGILAFQSKLAQTINGLKVGDHFQFQDEDFTVTQIDSYL